jgi:mannose-6-phosphate isomerase-like protein (cupin superfamily)
MSNAPIAGGRPQALASIDDVAPAAMSSDDGWRGLQIRFFGEDLTGARSGCVFHAQFPPGASHEAHSHPNADEFYYVISGRAVAGAGHEELQVGPGSLHYVRAGVNHWLRNVDEQEPVVIVGIYTGVGSLEEAGYEPVPAPSPAG